MPVCPECSFWTPNFHDGDVDHIGTYAIIISLRIYNLRWFCNGCWKAWENERREKRKTSGKLLPEDREISYAVIRSPLAEEDFDNELGFKLAVHQRYCADSDWFEADVNVLTISTSFGSCPSYLNSGEDKPKVVQSGRAAWYRSLDWSCSSDDEFRFDFSRAKVVIGSSDFPIRTLSELPYVLFPQHIRSSMFQRFRALARASRKHREMIREIEQRKERERDEQKRKQQAEIQQKQRDLVQLALKRAQNSTHTRKVVTVAPSPPPQKPANVWSSAAIPAVAQQPQQNSWSSSSARPMLPPPVPVAWSVVVPPPTQLSLQTALVHDPWSSAQNVWSSASQPLSKKPRQPSDSSNR